MLNRSEQRERNSKGNDTRSPGGIKMSEEKKEEKCPTCGQTLELRRAIFGYENYACNNTEGCNVKVVQIKRR